MVNCIQYVYVNTNISQADAVLAAARVVDENSRNDEGASPIPSVHFFEGKQWLEEKSTVFPLLKAMPKGAALHVRDH